MDVFVDILAKSPAFLSVPIVEAVASFSSQRHRCSNVDACGATAEVRIRDLVARPTAVLSDRGRRTVFAIAPEVFDNHPAVCRSADGAASTLSAPPTATTAQNPASAQARRGAQMASFFAPQQVRGWARMLVFSTTTPFGGDSSVIHHQLLFRGFAALRGVPLHLTEPRSDMATSSSYASAAARVTVPSPRHSARHHQHGVGTRKQRFEDVDFSADHFACQRCGSRLGIHTFPGDGTNGDKELLRDRLVKILVAMPGFVENATAPTMNRMTTADIYFQD
jgi:hypothetical protein